VTYLNAENDKQPDKIEWELYNLYLQTNISKNVKDKAIPGQAYSDPERSRRLKLPDFKTVGT
jgi:hypothetical protein